MSQKMRRKKGVLEILVILTVLGISTAATAPSHTNCSADANCMNGGVCRDHTCICADGWQGSHCQFCTSKVRLTEPEGVIRNGLGNYTARMKCSWLIDTRTNRADLKNTQDPKKIRLNLENLATECGWDHLYVYDGDSVRSPLLGVFSGLMHKKDFSTKRVPEIVAKSGSALLHFTSDDGHSIGGFNISYKVNGCPTNDSRVDCSGFGTCFDDGSCSCTLLHTCEACNIPMCPKDCSSHLNQGTCDEETKRCRCSQDFAGDDCSQVKANGVWSSVIYSLDSPPPTPSASQSASVFHDTLHIIGGESYGRSNMVSMYDFNGNFWINLYSDNQNSSKLVPKPRYGATTVKYDHKIFMYGGIFKEGITGELWAFDTTTKTWENLTVGYEGCHPYNNPMCSPLKLAGHTATIVRAHKKHVMFVIFGLSPEYGYLNTVQEYDFLSREWNIVETNGFNVKGRYGHSASYDLYTEKIYVYGGIVSESVYSTELSPKLYSYDPHKKTWKVLTPSSSARFLHTADFVSPGIMIVFGGNVHYDSSSNLGEKCYSQDLLAYDAVCDTWVTQNMPNGFKSDLDRFGHSSVVFDNSLYIYGGFNGQLLSDMIKFTLGDCSHFQSRSTCLNDQTGLKCVWKSFESKCVPITNAPKRKDSSKDYILCKKNRHQVKDQEKMCEELEDCHSCVSSSYGCVYCGNGTCRKGICGEKDELFTNQVNTWEKCPKGRNTCDQHNCLACSADRNCFWNPLNRKCNKSPTSRTIRSIYDYCPTPCSSMDNCKSCTQGDCIWCQSAERCIDQNAYIANFPYGQCRGYTNRIESCQSEPQCGGYQTCNQCRNDPACGWCDDGSMTGLGTCLTGGGGGPQDVWECPERSWFFTSCPNCQCNGHSTCSVSDEYICQQPCQNSTTGRNCEKCMPGFWGNPLNGGACRKCECNGQNTLCNPDSGKCWCSTKGLKGDRCDKCDDSNEYKRDPMKGSCIYELFTNYQLTFNLSKKEDIHFTKINFKNSPYRPDVHADLKISCSVPARMNISVRAFNEEEKVIFSNLICSRVTFEHRFLKANHIYGSTGNITFTTFYVTVYDIHPPLWIQASFVQHPKLSLQPLFISLAVFCIVMISFCFMCMFGG